MIASFTVSKEMRHGSIRGRQEREANYFARCLLMPKKLVQEFFLKNDLDNDSAFKKFCKEFAVPPLHAMRRIMELGYLEEKKR